MSILSDMESFDLSEEVRQSVLLLESKWQKKQLELFIDLDELEYRGNKALLNQVWINLIDNAIKFSPQNGKIKLKLHKKKDQVVFQILDNGCGMDEDTKTTYLTVSTRETVPIPQRETASASRWWKKSCTCTKGKSGSSARQVSAPPLQ